MNPDELQKAKDETLQRMLVMQAFLDGKHIEFSPKGGMAWRSIDQAKPCYPIWAWNSMDYRIKVADPVYAVVYRKKLDGDLINSGSYKSLRAAEGDAGLLGGTWDPVYIVEMHEDPANNIIVKRYDNAGP